MDDVMTDMLGFLAGPLGVAMRWLYDILHSYGWTIIVVTFVVRILMFPLTIMQQKSTARTAAYQPMMNEIRDKWKNDKNRQNQELMKFQEENKIKMTAGCAPMIVNMLVLFSIIAAVQAPLKYIVNVPTEQIDYGVSIVSSYDDELGKKMNGSVRESILIGEIRDNPARFTTSTEIKDKDGKTLTVSMEKEWVEKIKDFKFDFLGMDMSDIPSFSKFSSLILPALSLLTSFGMQFVMQKTSGQAMKASQFWMSTIMMVVMFGWFAFTAPIAFSLYYTVSNVAMVLQQLLVKRIHDPEKEKQKIIDEMEERKKARKAKKKVIVQDKNGKNIEKEVNESELSRIRLARAREMDLEKYSDDVVNSSSSQNDDGDDDEVSETEEK